MIAHARTRTVLFLPCYARTTKTWSRSRLYSTHTRFFQCMLIALFASSAHTSLWSMVLKLKCMLYPRTSCEPARADGATSSFRSRVSRVLLELIASHRTRGKPSRTEMPLSGRSRRPSAWRGARKSQRSAARRDAAGSSEQTRMKHAHTLRRSGAHNTKYEHEHADTRTREHAHTRNRHYRSTKATRTNTSAFSLLLC